MIDMIADFWTWFTANEERLGALYSSEQYAILAAEVNRELDKVDPRLAWEIGAGKLKTYLLTISGEGNRKLWELAQVMLSRAPSLKRWEFYPYRPARPAPKTINLTESGKKFDTTNWEFVPVERFECGRLDLIIVDDELAHSDRECALKAVSIFLDQVLGEDTVESSIGKFSIKSHGENQQANSLSVAELVDYVHRRGCH